MHFIAEDEGNQPVCRECGTGFLDITTLEKHRCPIKERRALNERSVFMTGFNDRIDSNAVREALTPFGNVEKVVIDKEWDRFAIVQFENKQQAESAIERRNIKIQGESLLMKKPRLKMDNPGFQPPVITLNEILAEINTKGFASMHEQLINLQKAFGIDNSAKSLREQICRFVEKHLLHYYATDVKARLFGSSLSGLGMRYADVDINLVVSSPSAPPANCTVRDVGNAPLAMLAKQKLLWQEYCSLSSESRQDLVYRVLYDVHSRWGIISHVRSITKTKCPVVRFTYNGVLSCELSFGNNFSEFKAKFLSDYTRDSNGVLHLILFTLRLWAQMHGIFGTNASNKQTAFKSYAFSLVFVAYLQSVGILQPVRVLGQQQIDGWFVDYIVPDVNVPSDNESIGSIIRGFFIFASRWLNDKNVISIRDGKVYSIEEFRKFVAPTDSRVAERFDQSFVNIQDPLELTHNVCSSVSRISVSLLRRKAMHSLAGLKNAPTCLGTIFDPESWQASNENAHKDCNEITLTVDQNLEHTAVFEAANSLFEDVLNFESETEYCGKRPKLASNAVTNFSSYFSTVATWIGRRPIKRELQRQYPNEKLIEIERMVSLAIDRRSRNQDGRRDSFVAIEFKLETEYDPDTGNLRLQFRPMRNENWADLFHFLTQFLVKDEYALLRGLIGFSRSAGPTEDYAMEVD